MTSTRRAAALLLALAALCGALYASQTRHGPALADEFIYLAGAQHFARTGSLDARYYDAFAILKVGHPHQDAHSPGYVLMLGSAVAVTRASGVSGLYWTAVALNALAWAGMGLLGLALSRGLGLPPRVATASGALVLLLPALLPYVFWSMQEVLVPAALLAALTLAVTRGERWWGALGASLLCGLAFLLRETSLFGFPVVAAALLGQPRPARRLAGHLAALLAFLVLVHAPLSARRPAGVRFWELPWGHPAAAKADAPPSGGAMLRELKQGALGPALGLAGRRVAWNVRDLLSQNVSPTERGILALYGLLPLLALPSWRGLGPLARRVLVGALVGWAALLAVLFGAYSVGLWGGFRYLMGLMPAFLPFVAAGLGAGLRGALPAILVGLGSLALNVGVLQELTSYKISRQKRQRGVDEYVSRYVKGTPERIALPSGWLYGLARYPLEVISSLPPGGGELRLLERAVWFDYLVLPGESPLAAELDARAKYQRLNPEPEPPLLIYRRLK